jgi:hypothetical protein
MLWIYRRDKETLQIETRFESTVAEFVLVIRRPDGTQEEERFQEAASFGRRLEILEKQVEAERWTSAGAPVFLRDGWKI